MPRAVVISKESSLKGLVTDARLPYPSREVRLASGQQQLLPSQGRSTAPKKHISIPRQSLTPSPGRMFPWSEVSLDFNEQARGISFRDVRSGSPSLLRSGGAPAFKDPVPQDRAEFRIVWPGYGHVTSTYSLPTTVAGRPITVWELACKVVECYASFFEHARRAKVSRGNERWDVKAFDLDTLVLIHFGNTDGHRAVFQATVQTVLL